MKSWPTRRAAVIMRLFTTLLLSELLLQPSAASTATATTTTDGALVCTQRLDHGVTVQYYHDWRTRSSGADEDSSFVSLRITRPKRAWLGVAAQDEGGPFFVGLPDPGHVRVLPLPPLPPPPLLLLQQRKGEDHHHHPSGSSSNQEDEAVRRIQKSSSIQQTPTHTTLSLTFPWDELKHDDGDHHSQYHRHIYVASGVENTYGEPDFVLSVALDPVQDCWTKEKQGEQDASFSSSSSSSSSSTARHRKLQTQPASGGSRTANQNVWKAHGILMTAAWAIIIPLAVTTSLVRELLSDGSWFYIHRFLNSLAVLCVVTAFVLAFYAIHQEDDQSHFRKTDHRAIGVSALFLVMIQAILGYARPQREIEAIEAGVVVADEAKTSPQPQPQPTPEDGIVPNTTDPERKEKAADKEDDDEAIELTDLRKLWSLQHRLVGFCLVGVCWYNIHRGIVLYEDRFGDILTDRSTTAIFWGGMIGFVISVFVLVTVVRSFT
eukprot:scaffold1380_cov161-Amphora_coffeaeformis.AAC.9